MARDGEQQAMTSERLAEIRQNIAPWLTGTPVSVQPFVNDMVDLLAAYDAAMEIVRMVAHQDCAQDIDDPEWLQCLACGGGGPTGDSIEHYAICYYVKARALLASAESEGSGGDGA